MIRKKITLTCLLSLLVSSTAFSQELLTTAEHQPVSGSRFSVGAGISGDDGRTFDNHIAQTFTAEQSGRLIDLNFLATRQNENTNADLRIDIVTWDTNQIVDVLGTTYLPASEFKIDTLSSDLEFNQTADFSDLAIIMNAGQQFAMVFSTDTRDANYRLVGNKPDYNGGRAFRSRDGTTFSEFTSTSDLFFEARVVAVPEPTVLFPLVGLTACFFMRRTRKTINHQFKPFE